jgi:hypothetical protein
LARSPADEKALAHAIARSPESGPAIRTSAKRRPRKAAKFVGWRNRGGRPAGSALPGMHTPRRRRNPLESMQGVCRWSGPASDLDAAGGRRQPRRALALSEGQRRGSPTVRTANFYFGGRVGIRPFVSETRTNVENSARSALGRRQGPAEPSFRRVGSTFEIKID